MATFKKNTVSLALATLMIIMATVLASSCNATAEPLEESVTTCFMPILGGCKLDQCEAYCKGRFGNKSSHCNERGSCCCVDSGNPQKSR
ncbi:unnamed protein product [Urochloa decumbens]|uniref:Uncharacterized protein n=1 Tax=Urochloa decumbens TaxID=240449 RepID=A0ABC8YFX4_9POAL